MITRKDYLLIFTYSVLAAVMYTIPVFFFIRNATYTDAWLLYLGNGLFLAAIALFMLMFNKKRSENASTVVMLTTGHITTVAGIFLACIMCFLLLSFMVPGLFETGTTDKVLTDAPANAVDDKTNGLNFMVLMNAVIGNVSAGSFIAILFAFTAKRDQTRETTIMEG